MLRHFYPLSLLFVLSIAIVGCGPSQPPALENVSIEVEGEPNAKFYLSVEENDVKIEGRSKSIGGTTNYGVMSLDENGHYSHEISSEVVHGISVVVVGVDKPVKLKVSSTTDSEQVKEIGGKLEHAKIDLGFQKEVDPDMPASTQYPEASLYEVNEYFKGLESENEQQEEGEPANG